jgi:DNA-directed RNA polymerase subunit RPC12/RpoP
MIRKQGERQQETYSVLCSWCGAKIREDKKADTTGVCLKCFYQILTNHLRTQKRTVYGDFVSDR